MKYNRYPKRDAIKNYFPLPNEIFMLGLSTGELSVYSFLMYCENRKTFQCHPSYKTIGKAIRKSENAVRKYVTGLEEKSLITTEPTSIFTKDGRKRNGSLLYTIRPIQEALDLFYEWQMQRVQETAQRQRAEQQLAKRARVGSCEPLCEALESAASPSPSEEETGKYAPSLSADTRTKEKAG